MNKHLIKIIGLVFVVLLVILGISQILANQSDQNIGRRTDNSGLSVRSVGSNTYSQIDSNIEAIVPDENNGADLGSPALNWNNGYFTNLYANILTASSTSVGTSTFENLTVDGNTVLNGNVDNTGTLGNIITAYSIITTPPGAVRSFTAAGGIDTTNVNRFDFMYVQGSGGAVTITATPSIAPGLNGKELCLFGNSDVNTLTIQDNDVLAGSGVETVGNIAITLGDKDQVCFRYLQAKAIWAQSSPFMDN